MAAIDTTAQQKKQETDADAQPAGDTVTTVEVPTADRRDDETADSDSTPEGMNKARSDSRRWRFHSINMRALALLVVIGALATALGVTGWLYAGARGELDDQNQRAAMNARVEKISLDYAVNAATMNFENLNAWQAQLVEGTSPELSEKLTTAAKSMEQILVPLKWVSTAQPLVAKVRSENNAVYTVDCFVSVQTQTAQAPDPLQSTATYSLTIDGNNDFQITDVGGIASVVGEK